MKKLDIAGEHTGKIKVESIAEELETYMFFFLMGSFWYANQ